VGIGSSVLPNARFLSVIIGLLQRAQRHIVVVWNTPGAFCGCFSGSFSYNFVLPSAEPDRSVVNHKRSIVCEAFD
jgi:hypothetical protein